MDPKRGSSTTLIGIVVLLVVAVGVGCLVVPAFLFSTHQPVERSAAACLMTLRSAEADFRANDRDWNQVNDYWTGDVKGLYTMTAAAVRGNAGTTTIDPSIKLIELSVACADADRDIVRAGGENAPLEHFAVPSAKAGYWFGAMDLDRTIGNGTPESFYKQDTGGDPPMGRCHNYFRFGFVAFPDSTAGEYVFITNEKGEIYRRKLGESVRPSTLTPPGLGGRLTPYLSWPNPKDLQAWENAH
jgi:hypothetical protein